MSAINVRTDQKAVIGLRLNALDTKVDKLSSHLASNLTELTASLENLEAKINNSDATHVQQRVDKLENESLPELKRMVRHSIKKSKENFSSIEELKQHDHSVAPVNQSTPVNFDMINTLMVSN